MKKVIVTTSVQSPTKAIQKFDAMKDWELIVIGDLKTPKDFRLNKGTYISPEDQEKYDKPLSDAIGWNCIQRRNFGLLLAHDMKADIIALVDDDNIPMEGWGKDLLIGTTAEVNYYETCLPAFDPMGATQYKNLWHRGFPIQLIPERDYTNNQRKKLSVDIQADFWNGDPDIDAFCRIEHSPVCVFDDLHFPIAGNKISPFNSQNTFLKGSLLNDYFLFPHAGRMDDIWASYYLQTKRKCNVVYGKASVFHERNPHNLLEDLIAEYPGYENNLKIILDSQTNPDALFGILTVKSTQAFHLYKKHFD